MIKTQLRWQKEPKSANTIIISCITSMLTIYLLCVDHCVLAMVMTHVLVQVVDQKAVLGPGGAFLSCGGPRVHRNALEARGNALLLCELPRAAVGVCSAAQRRGSVQKLLHGFDGTGVNRCTRLMDTDSQGW